MLYVDNGREYLTYDIGGKGHQTLKVKVNIKLPTPILQRLGIQMINALPANSAAKHIERDFKDFTFLPKLMDGYCGSNVVVKPESLKHNIKQGKLPTDSQFVTYVNNMIDGYFKLQPYNGKVIYDKGNTKIEIYSEYCKYSRRVKDENVLNLMLMRSSKAQTVGRRGVHLTISGQRIDYFNKELLDMQGKKVYWV